MTRDGWVDRVARFAAGARDASFEELAWGLHRWQRGRDPVLAAFAADAPLDGDWRRIPAVPVDLFRDPGIGRPGGVTFRTSGTTGGRGAHHLADTRLYDATSPRWADACVPGRPRRTVALLASPAEAPDSSLSHMVALLGEPVAWHVRGGRLDVPSLAALPPEPLFVPATAFALAEWLEAGPPTLPAGSIVMITGGYKGRIRRIEAADLVRETRRALRPARVVLEYGMTELSSQLWGAPGAPFLPPPWLRAVAVDPAGDPVPAGVAGQLRFVDLCNVDAAVAIETMDHGAVGVDGAVTLHGRLAGAPLRGCSLPLEEAR